MENITTAERNKMAVTFGLLLGLIHIVITSGINTLVGSFFLFNSLKVVAYFLYFIIMGIFATRIKKANGGYIEFRELFGAVFIMVIIGGFMTYVYTYVYIDLIDTDFMNKLKTSTVSFMERNKNIPDERIEETVKSFDKQMAEAKTLNLGKNLITFLQAIVMDSLFGLLVCLAVRKSRPVFQQ
jgi:hypothetical protein